MFLVEESLNDMTLPSLIEGRKAQLSISSPKHRVVKWGHSGPKLNREVFRVASQQPTSSKQVPKHKAERCAMSLNNHENAVKDLVRHGLE